jgi:TolB-like protein/DNA-binding winged helix-turn-helix (wHTH) protein/Tfp pilus assembly protein PilF
MHTSAPERRLARFGLFEADLQQRMLTKNGLRVRLQDQPFQVLALLLERPGEIVSREEIRENLWPVDTYVEFDDGLNTAIKKLRLALGDASDNPRFIETVPRRGYRFVAPVFYPSPSPGDLSQTSVPNVRDKADVVPEGPQAIHSDSTQGEAAALPRLSLRNWLVVLVVLALLLSSYLAFAIWRERRTAALKSIRSIAVLPMQNLSSEPDQEYFAEGVSDELTTRLAQISALKVISRTSTMQYKSTKKNAPQIGRELGVDALVEGSIERVGDLVRVRVQLIQAATDRHLWAESYERKLGDVLLLENDLAREITRQVEVHTADPPPADLANLGRADANALQDYLQGNHYWALRTDGGLPKAIEYFNRSIAEDPNFVRSYAALANCYIVAPMLAQISQTAAYPKAVEASQKALALDNSLPEAHLAAAEVALYVSWDFAGAEKEFRRALELSPNYATAHQWYGEYLSLMGRHTEAIREDQAATQLDPASAIAHHQLGNTLQAARQYDRAMEEYRLSMQLSPNFDGNYHSVMWLQRRQNKYGEALATMRIGNRLYVPSGQDTWLVDEIAAAYASGGRTGYLKKEVQLAAEGSRPALYMARDYAVLGDKTMALHWLELAYQQHDFEVLYMNADPEFDGLRSDPRYKSLARAVGFH